MSELAQWWHCKDLSMWLVNLFVGSMHTERSCQCHTVTHSLQGELKNTWNPDFAPLITDTQKQTTVKSKHRPTVLTASVWHMATQSQSTYTACQICVAFGLFQHYCFVTQIYRILNIHHPKCLENYAFGRNYKWNKQMVDSDEYCHKSLEQVVKRWIAFVRRIAGLSVS